MKQAKFSIGQCIHHRLFEYRGVIVDVDPEFLGREEWYQTMANTRPPRNEPWYHVLVHDSGRETYVAERNLQADDTNEPINHPLLREFFTRYEHGHYHSGRHIN